MLKHKPPAPGLRLGDTRPDPAIRERRRLERELAEAEAALREAVVNDWPRAVESYLHVTDAQHALGGFADIPYFSAAVDRLLYRAVIERRNAG